MHKNEKHQHQGNSRVTAKVGQLIRDKAKEKCAMRPEIVSDLVLADAQMAAQLNLWEGEGGAMGAAGLDYAL